AATAPSARFDGKPVLVVREQDTWLAIVGLPLTQKPGTAQLTLGSRTLSFTVGSKKYPEQRITLKNKRQVNPDPADLKRIDAELAEQIKAYRS
ncbi:M23 family peptidase, partial [Pseudomonas frederiksbergensis]|nr:M23 family peptidase [Pseudomonas frederiksbergensis]